MNTKRLLSWIIPCFNEEASIRETIQRIIKVSNSLTSYSWEVILIDDGSIDNTRKLIRSIIDKEERVKLLALSRNFGHQYAVQAGLEFCSGSAAIIIDADLQDPPELARDLISLWEDGYQVVYGQRIERASESIFKRMSALLFYRLLNILSEIIIPVDTGDFRLIDRKVINALIQMPEKGRFIRGLVSWSGFSQIAYKYKRQGRFAGSTKYSFSKMFLFAIEGITSFSRRPLRLSTIFGVLCSFISFLGILYVIYIRLFTSAWVAGWAALVVIVLFTSGVQLICLGILGEYIGRIYVESKSRPMYFIDEIYESSKNKV